MELATGARRRLLSDPTVSGYVAGKVFRYRLEESLEATAGMAVVVYPDNAWATPRRNSRIEFPILTLDCYADPDRTASLAIAVANGEDKAFALYRACDRVLHNARGEWWGPVESGLMVISCHRLGEPYVETAKTQHPGDPSLGDVVKVSVNYAVETSH